MHLLRGVPHAPSLNTPIIPLQNCNKIIMFIDYYFLRFCDKLRDSSPNPKNRSTLRPYWVPSAVMSLYAAGFSSLYDVLGVIKFCAPPHSWVSSLSAFDFSFSFFLFLFSLSLRRDTSCSELTLLFRVVFKECVLIAWQSGEPTDIRAGSVRVCTGLQLKHSAVRRSKVGGDLRSRSSCVQIETHRTFVRRHPHTGPRRKHHGNDYLHTFYRWIPAVRGAWQVSCCYINYPESPACSLTPSRNLTEHEESRSAHLRWWLQLHPSKTNARWSGATKISSKPKSLVQGVFCGLLEMHEPTSDGV